MTLIYHSRFGSNHRARHRSQLIDPNLSTAAEYLDLGTAMSNVALRGERRARAASRAAPCTRPARSSVCSLRRAWGMGMGLGMGMARGAGPGTSLRRGRSRRAAHRRVLQALGLGRPHLEGAVR